MTNSPKAAQALSLAADIRARHETGIVPFIAWDSLRIAELLEGLAGEIQELRGGVEEEREHYRRLTEAACRELEGVREWSTQSRAS
ncbi:hypothetical protein D3C87_777540 [compost metagenome]